MQNDTRRLPALAVALCIMAAAIAGCGRGSAHPKAARPSPVTASQPSAAQTRSPSPADSVLAGGAPGALTATFARRLFTSAPVVVVASGGGVPVPLRGAVVLVHRSDPAPEIIATVAQASPGADRSYSSASDVSALRPWVQRATSAGMYVILDLQPGRASLLAQAERYQSLLALPNVGLALDAEWKLQPRQLPLRQIGSVSIGEVNGVVRWLAALTAGHHLPQKVLVLHQFRLSMIQDERALDTSHDDLAIVVHMDGQGTPRMKQDTWDSVTKAAPRGVRFGWKNFLVKDHPMLSPRETMTKTPAPVMISYQ